MSFVDNIHQFNHRCCHVTDDGAFQKTRNGLAVSPAEIRELTNRGIPVNSQNASMYIEGTTSQGSFELPIDELRGADIVDAWNASRDAENKLVSAHRSDVRNYGQ